MRFTKRCERYKKGLTTEKSIKKILYWIMTGTGARNRMVPPVLDRAACGNRVFDPPGRPRVRKA